MTTRNTQKKNPHTVSPVAKPNSSKALDPREATSVSKMPPRKQKKVMDTILGLESDIKSIQQQLDETKKRLGGLTELMGIVLDDDKAA